MPGKWGRSGGRSGSGGPLDRVGAQGKGSGGIEDRHAVLDRRRLPPEAHAPHVARRKERRGFSGDELLFDDDAFFDGRKRCPQRFAVAVGLVFALARRDLGDLFRVQHVHGQIG